MLLSLLLVGGAVLGITAVGGVWISVIAMDLGGSAVSPKLAIPCVIFVLLCGLGFSATHYANRELNKIEKPCKCHTHEQNTKGMPPACVEKE
jgi:hypothetical protein